MSGGADVRVTEVVRTFTMPGGVPVEVLRGLSLQVAAGESLAVTGPSGSGKTTLLQLIGALDRPDSGEIRVNGRDLAGLDERAQCTFRNREVGFVFQSHHLLPQLTALENVLVPAWGADKTEERVAHARSLLERVGLADRCSHFPGQLSGGERQRVAVARALVMRPCLILADEPTGNLDSENSMEVVRLLDESNRDFNQTIIIITHDERVARAAKRIITLADGKIVSDERIRR